MNRADHAYTLQLSREWEHLRHHRPSLARARSWSLIDPGGILRGVTDSLDDLQHLIDATSSSRPDGDPVAADEVLAQLVDLARYDELAGRVVIQRILGGLVNAAARYRDPSCDIDPAEIIVAAAWIAIRNYDTGRRSRHVAASLISDAAFQAFRRPMRRRASSERAVPAEHLDWRPAQTDRSAFERLAEVVRLARQHGVPDHDLQLVRDLVRSGSPTSLAAERGVTTRTIRKHRERAVDQIRAAVLAA